MTTPLPRRQASFRGLIGLARADITPPIGIYARNWGAAKHDVADSIHRPLTLNVIAIAVDREQAPLILIDGDLGWWRPIERFYDWRTRLCNDLSIEPSRLIFALTHSHATPPLMQPDPELTGGDLLETWQHSVYEAAVATVRQAVGDLFPAIVDWQYGRCELAANRDLPDPVEGNDRLICGFHPTDKADDTLLVGRITDDAGTLRGTIVNYACHPTTLAWQNRSISPDYIGAMRSTIESTLGGIAIFLQGMSGDLAPRNQYVGHPAVADLHGAHLAYASLAALHNMEPPGTELVYDETVESGAPLAVWRHRPCEVSTVIKCLEMSVELKLKDWPSAVELEHQHRSCQDRAIKERLRRQRDIRRSLGDGKTFAHPIHLCRIGDAILVGSCSEAYSQLQQDLRIRFPGVAIACMNLINGSIGYLPPAALYDVDVYPVWQTPFARGGLERIRDAMIAGIEELITT